jgi:hypothetical protein
VGPTGFRGTLVQTDRQVAAQANCLRAQVALTGQAGVVAQPNVQRPQPRAGQVEDGPQLLPGRPRLPAHAQRRARRAGSAKAASGVAGADPRRPRLTGEAHSEEAAPRRPVLTATAGPAVWAAEAVAAGAAEAEAVAVEAAVGAGGDRHSRED